MAADLFKVDLNMISAAELYQAIELLTAVNLPEDQRPPESYVLDFKADLTDSTLKTVAAFANTFGGLVLLGVKEEGGRPTKLVGISTSTELKTRVASSIATNIVPCPSFEVADCPLPDESSRQLAAIRVRNTPQINFITTKNNSPVYIRNEDESRPANAGQLRRLIDKELGHLAVVTGSPPGRIGWNPDLFVSVASTEADRRDRTRSEIFLWIGTAPTTHLHLDIDSILEERFRKTISANFPVAVQEVQNGSALLEFLPRKLDSSELRYFHPEDDFERLWQIETTGKISFATQITFRESSRSGLWSLFDVAADLKCMVRTARQFWQSFGYYGDAQLAAVLRTGDLILYRSNEGLPTLRHPGFGPLPLNAVDLVEAPRNSAVAYAQLPAYRHLDHETLALVLNSLLRSLGHGANLSLLEAFLQERVPPLAQ